MPPWVGLAAVAAGWASLSTWLLLESWRAAANLLITLVALVRGRVKPSAAFGNVLGALISGGICSGALRGGFWFLVEVRGYGRTWMERGIYLGGVTLAARFMLPRLAARLRQAWRAATGEGPAEESLAKEAS